ncbi:hypothetical protein PPSIR1_24874 [Plesiocystis pacifica SIR-1]|uniref:DUF2306 domain-containing protein n=1 Tax=Plesiocystis pacifica SIR-1 TaxID=391625 RepID=A6G9G9_9BACT|nr:hypothetical protein [Plesiocystis pacifica]EDM77477.1 hypothetical protein PPSIR1_24874 [Plesiocystis pacifica SIR-1]
MAIKLAYDINLAVHAIAGLTAVLVLAVPLIAKKGGRVHARAGWVFTVAMAVVAVTGALLALAWATIPLTVKPPEGPRSAEQIAAMTQSYRRFSLFFATVGVMSGAAVWHGVAAVRNKSGGRRGGWRGVGDHLAYALTLGFGLALTLLGLKLGMALFIAFGALAFSGGLGDARAIWRSSTENKAWIIRHLQAMLGGATAALTAFSAFTLRSYASSEHAFDIAFWLLPVVAGVVASVGWTRSTERELGMR